MTGPGIGIITLVDLNPALRRLGSGVRVEVTDTGLDLFVSSTVECGGTYRGDPRPMVGGPEPVDWTADEAARVLAFLGWVPQEEWTLGAMGNRSVDHLVLAELAAHLAEEVGGVVDVEVETPPPVEVTRLGRSLLVSKSGRLHHYLLEPTVLRAWTTRPGFRIVK